MSLFFPLSSFLTMEEAERLQGDMSFSLKTTTDELDEIVEEILGSKF